MHAASHSSARLLPPLFAAFRHAARLLPVALLALDACASTMLPHQVRAGGSFLSAFDANPSAAMGFASRFAGPDAQRGAVLFVLCPRDRALCEVGSPLHPAPGALLETQLMTRVSADPFAPASLAGRIEEPGLGISMPLPGAAVALFRVPPREEGGPVPGLYRLEARILTPNGIEDLFHGAGADVEVVDGVGEPVKLPAPVSLAQIVPLPRITLSLAPDSNRSSGSARRAPAAADLLLRYPHEKVEIRGAAPVGGGAAATMVRVTPGPDRDTVRVAVIAPQGDARHQIGVAFALTGRALAPVTAAEFQIVEQRLYDERGAADDSIRFQIEPVVR
jgi:hypothetical protein